MMQRVAASQATLPPLGQALGGAAPAYPAAATSTASTNAEQLKAIVLSRAKLGRPGGGAARAAAAGASGKLRSKAHEFAVPMLSRSRSRTRSNTKSRSGGSAGSAGKGDRATNSPLAAAGKGYVAWVGTITP